MSRRHFGSVRRLPSRRYQASYWFNGQRHTAKLTFEKKTDALAYLAEIEVEVRRGLWINPVLGKLLIRELGEIWFSSNPAKRPNSVATDRYHLEAHIVPRVGELKISEVTPRLLQSFVNDLMPHLASKTVSRAYGVLRAMFSYAVEVDLLFRSPCRGIKLPRIDPRPRQVLNSFQVAAVAEATPLQYRPMIWIGAITGLRFSEVAALRVQNFDPLIGSLSVTSTVTKDGQGRAILGPPKSAASKRTLAIPRFLIEMLTAHLAVHDIDVDDEDAFLFTSPDGGLIRYANWRNRVWLPSCKRAGLTGIGFHDLRRLSATTLVHEGVDIKTAQTRLGHSDPRLTIGLYAQAIGSADTAAADRLGEILYLPSTEDSDDERSGRETAGQATPAKKGNRSRTTRPKLSKWCEANAL